MKRAFRIALIIPLICSLLFLGVPAFAAQQNDSQDFTTDRIIVKFNSGTNGHTEYYLHDRLRGSVVSRNDKLGFEVVQVPAGKASEKAAAYKADKSVEYAEPDYIAQAYLTPDDTYYSSQWGAAKIQDPQAWDITTGAADVLIAILDTGVDQNHEDLAEKIVASKNFTTSATTDDIYGHGTHVAGIAAAVTDNATGVAGTGFNCSIMNVKVLDDNGSGNYSWIANGIVWAADNGAKVINMSLGGSSGSTAMKTAVDYAWSKGVVIVAAAGNSGKSSASYPAYYPNCIAVAATDPNDVKASWSNYGSWVDVAAPGVSIYSTLPNHASKVSTSLSYGYLSGTSMATPYVAGEAALLWATSYGTGNASVRARIEGMTDPIAAGVAANGRINAYRAVSAAPIPPVFSLGVSPTSRSIARGSSATYVVSVAPGAGFTGTVALTATGLPSGATSAFNPVSITASGTSTLTVKTTTGTPVGTYTIKISGACNGLIKTVNATLTVKRK